MQQGFSLTFPDGTEFVAKRDISITYGTESQFVFSGLNNTVALFEEYLNAGGKTGRSNSKMSSVRIGSGAGIHRITISFFQFEGSDETWGDSNPGDSARSKLETLDRSITEDAPTTNDPAVYEGGEYSTSGKYDPIDVIIESSNLPYDVNENVSGFTGSITLLDSVDFQEAIDSLQNDEG